MSGCDDCRAADPLLPAPRIALHDEARTVAELERLGEAVVPFQGS